MTTTAKKPTHYSARKAAGRRNSRIWHRSQKQPEAWFSTPASPVRVIEPGSPEWNEIAERYGVAS
jgi:hypothetical protein